MQIGTLFFFPERPWLRLDSFHQVDPVKIFIVTVKLGQVLVLHLGHGQAILKIEFINSVVVQGAQIDSFLGQLQAPQRKEWVKPRLDLFLGKLIETLGSEDVNDFSNDGFRGGEDDVIAGCALKQI